MQVSEDLDPTTDYTRVHRVVVAIESDVVIPL
jgi:hypothetical protein